jgi:uncharacterized delta-60 repeat protein
MAVQPDGRLVLAGTVYSVNSKSEFALERYNVNGSLDTTFGTGGQALADFGSDAAASAVAVQADGRIVVAGRTDGGFALARYYGNGSLDSSFGASGKVLTDFAGYYGLVNAVAVQPDGQIVAAGTFTDANGNTYIALARYQGR